jgi:hypothetical protein
MAATAEIWKDRPQTDSLLQAFLDVFGVPHPLDEPTGFPSPNRKAVSAGSAW